MSVISNTTVVSNLAEIGELDLLRQLFGAVHISVEVYDEIQNGLQEGFQFYACIDQILHPIVETGWLRLTSIADERELRLLGQLPARLHQGEMSSLVIACCRNWTLLTDDRLARREASRLGIGVSGSLGCLVLAIERGLCTLERANIWLADMIRHGYRSPVADLTSLLR